MLASFSSYNPVQYSHLEIRIILIRQGHILRLLEFPVVLCDQTSVDMDLGRLQSRTCDKFQRGISTQLPRQPQKGFLKVVIAFRRDIKVLEILLAVECDCFGFDFAVFDVDFIPAEDDGDVFADAHEVTVPVGDVLVCNAGGHVKHDDATLTLDVVSVSQPSEFLLTSSVPCVEANLAKVGVECDGMDFNT